MRVLGSVVWLGCLVASGCLQPALVPCGDLACPVGSQCIADACASDEDIAACVDLAEGAACSTSNILRGFCVSGVCIEVVCGDHEVGIGEVCDDGNVTAGDGCSSDCRSNETCGNGVVDGIAVEQCDEGVANLSSDGCTSGCLVEFANWEDISPPELGDLGGHAMAYDPVRHRTVLVTGDQTWELEGDSWRRVFTPTSPPPRILAAMTYDAQLRRIVLFGGDSPQQLGLKNDTWLYDGISWTELDGPRPPARREAAMAFDPIRMRTVMFGGGSIGVQRADTWELVDGVWVEAHPTVSPPLRNGHAMTFDASTQRVLLFGGRNVVALNDTWEFDGTTWAPRPLASAPPPARDKLALVYAPTGAHVILYGGRSSSIQPLGDTWVLEYDEWFQIGPLESPPLAVGHTMVFDQEANHVVMVGPGTWTFDESTWLHIAQESAPRGRHGTMMVFDPLRGRPVVFGGGWSDYFVLDDTWELSPGGWLRRDPPTSPISRAYASGIWDAKRSRVVMFGGWRGEDPSVDDTWSYDGEQWTDLAPLHHPPASYRHRAAYDTARDRVVLFGGMDDTEAPVGTWEFDGTDWIEQHPATSPSPRADHAMAYDEARNRTVVFGGSDVATAARLADTWEYDGTTWTEIQTTTTPPAGGVNRMLYDPQRRKLVLLTGVEMWELDGAHWSRVPVPITLPIHYESGLVYDSVAQAIVLYGSDYQTDTWRFTYRSASASREQCETTTDADEDGAIGCGDATHPADVDCWGRCTPTCPPGTTCGPDQPRCGDGACNAFLEDYALCPADCSSP